MLVPMAPGELREMLGKLVILAQPVRQALLVHQAAMASRE